MRCFYLCVWSGEVWLKMRNGYEYDSFVLRCFTNTRFPASDTDSYLGIVKCYPIHSDRVNTTGQHQFHLLGGVASFPCVVLENPVNTSSIIIIFLVSLPLFFIGWTRTVIYVLVNWLEDSTGEKKRQARKFCLILHGTFCFVVTYFDDGQ